MNETKLISIGETTPGWMPMVESKQVSIARSLARSRNRLPLWISLILFSQHLLVVERARAFNRSMAVQ